MTKFIWEEVTANCWTAKLGDEHVATVRRPIKLTFRHRGWRVTDVLGRFVDSRYHGEDLFTAKREAEETVTRRVDALHRALRR